MAPEPLTHLDRPHVGVVKNGLEDPHVVDHRNVSADDGVHSADRDAKISSRAIPFVWMPPSRRHRSRLDASPFQVTA